MKRGAQKREREVTFVETPRSTVEVALKRIRPLHRSWASWDGFNLESLLLSVYLQGLLDGYETRTRAASRERKATDEADYQI